VRDVYDKVADNIRTDSVKDISVNTLAKAAKYSHELQSVFESKRINSIVKKLLDPAFKKKHQEENDLQALHSRNDAHGADVRGGRRARGGAGHGRGRGLSNEHGRGHDKSADRSKSPDRGEVMCFACDSSEHRAVDLKCPSLRRSLAQLFKSVLNFQMATKARRKRANSYVNLSSCAMGRKRASASWVDLEEGSGLNKTIKMTKTRRRRLLLGQ